MSNQSAEEIIKQMLDEFNKITNRDTHSIAQAVLYTAKQAGYDATTAGQTITIGGVQSNPSLGFVDLKPAFRNSSNVRYSKSAHDWYMIVPIRRKVKSMSSSLYKRARQIEVNSTAYLDNLLEERQPAFSPYGTIPTNYNNGKQNLGGNLTRIANKNGNGSSYVAFRTVSAKSPMNSWIVRYNLNTDEKDMKTLSDIIDKVVGS